MSGLFVAVLQKAPWRAFGSLAPGRTSFEEGDACLILAAARRAGLTNHCLNTHLAEAQMSNHFAGLDVGDKATAIAVVNSAGAFVFETTVATEPEEIWLALKPYRKVLKCVGQEAGSKAAWLHRGLSARKLPMVCLDPRRTHAALSAGRNKTDLNDARGIAHLLHRGVYAESFIKDDAAQRLYALILHRRALVNKALSLELLVRATLKTFEGSATPPPKPRRRPTAFSAPAMSGTLRAIATLRAEANTLQDEIFEFATGDAVCKRLMTMPGVGPITAATFRAAIGDPSRFASSRVVGAYFGLTPRTFQSGQSSFTGHISRRGDKEVRAALYRAASALINKSKSRSRLKTWAMGLRARKGFRSAATACARRMAVILHRMWVSGQDFDESP